MKRWELVSRDVNGRVLGVERFWFRRNAEATKRFHDGTADGSRLWLPPIPPLFTNEVRRVSLIREGSDG